MTGHSDYLGRDRRQVAILYGADCELLAQLVERKLAENGRNTALIKASGEGDAERAIASVSGTNTTFVVISTDGSTLPPRANRALQKRSIPCLFVAISEQRCRIGPWTYYGHTACWKCDDTATGFFYGGPAARLDAHRPSEADMAGSIAVAFDDIASGRSELISGMIFVDSPGRSVERTLKDPLCPICSRWSRQPTEAFYVEQA